MASTGPDIRRAYENLFIAASMIPADNTHGVEFKTADKSVNFRLLGPATLHVVETFFQSFNHLITGLILSSTKLASRHLLLKLKELNRWLWPPPGL